jgi:putative aldouronate transport system permease protein
LQVEKNVTQIPSKKNKKIMRKSELPLHLMLLPGILVIIIFHYVPMGGIVIAFQRFIPAKGLFGPQEWIGFDNFQYIFSMPNTINVLRNTVTIAFWKIVLGLVVPITVALLLNELSSSIFKRSIQTVIYFPHFLSWIVFGAIVADLLSPSEGIINIMLSRSGITPVYFLGDNRYFRGTMILTDIWKNFGYGTVVYMAAITGIDPNLYEAATIDGAGRWKQTLHITLPGMSMIIVLMMVLSLGNVLNAGFDQIFNLYSPVVYETGDIIDTMVYRLGLESAKYGPAAAVGLFKSFVSLLFISTSYLIAYKLFNYKLF